MANFITRIQLHSAGETDYDALHAAMKKESFAITGKNSRNAVGSIRRAEEYKRKGETLKDITDAVFRAVRKISGEYSFTIIKEQRS